MGIDINKQKMMMDEFGRIVKQTRSIIYTVCYMFAEDRDTVQDMFQDVLINIWSGLERLRPGSDTGAWVWRVSLNTCISYGRKRKKRPEIFPLDIGVDLFEDTDEDTRQARMLHERIRKLGVFDRAILLLWLEDLSYAEIGEIMGMTTGNVSVRLARIREKMK